ncbi:MAG: cation-translocating P-type ATPase [Cupriavidus necator]
MPREVDWHASSVEQAFELLASSPEGLTGADAHERLRVHGPNRLRPRGRESWLLILLRQLNNPLVYVLLAAATLAVLMGKVTDGFVVLAVVVLNTLIGFVQEFRASKAIDALTRMVPEHATVLREGQQTEIPTHDIVPGDIVMLEPGDKVPADLRLIEAKNLQIEEAALTGESVPAAKQVRPVPADAGVGDRYCMAFGGTLVTSGAAAGLAVATGDATELGRISDLLHETTAPQTPLVRRLAKLAQYITLSILLVAGVIFVIGVLRGAPLIDGAFAAITLAVAAIPEGLPAVVTIASALGVRAMARRHAIMRYLPAVETLGSTTVICTDKTGTLTRNEMTVQMLWTPAGEYRLSGTGYVPQGALSRDGLQAPDLPPDVEALLRSGLLCNDASLADEQGRWSISGDPTEGALVVAARKLGMDESALREAWPRRDVVPFDSQHQYMASLHATPARGTTVCLKGAPEVVSGMCTSFADGSALQPERIHDAVEALAARGMRVLAIASGTMADSTAKLETQTLGRSFQLLGLAGMIDPLRDEAIAAVRACHQAGITVKMVTGDHPLTAGAVAAQLGLLDHALEHEVVAGKHLAEVSDHELEGLVKRSNVFARVAPEHKLRLVKALQANGEIVAMTGDGVNDAPALKRADIGVAMGIGGTAVAKEAADMVLADDNFASIAAAVEEGRRVYDNLIKSLAFILPTSLGQAMLILVAVLFFPEQQGRLLMPIEPVQILWVNLVVAIALALPLAFEAKEPDVMRRPPRAPTAPLLSGFIVVRTFLVAALMTGGAVALFFHEYLPDLERGIPPAAALAESQTVVVTTIIIFQAIYLLNCRSLTNSVWRIGLFANRQVYAGIAATLLLQLALVYIPSLNRLFHTSPLDPTDWIAPVLVGLIGLPVIALEKRWWRQREQASRSQA